MRKKEYDFIIIGGGAAGFAAAIKADELGAKTAMINAGLPIGGTCVNVGCVPTKHLLEVGRDYYAPQHPRFASLGRVKAEFNFKQAIEEKNKLVAGFRQSKYKNVVANLKRVTFVAGRAEFVSAKEIKVGKDLLTAKKFLITTGSSSKILPILGLDQVDYLTNVEALNLKRLPKSIIILGGGPLGLEFAQLFRHFGTKVTVIELMDKILSAQENEISLALRKYLETDGITLKVGAKTTRVQQKGGLKNVEIKSLGKTFQLSAEELLLAAGVVGNTSNMGLEEIGVKIGEGGFIKVNKYYQTSVPNIWAAGDVAGPPWLETVAAKEGNLAARNALSNAKLKVNYDAVPYAVFTSPQVGSVGLTEEEYMKRFKTCACRVVWMDQVPKALAVKETRGLIKMVIHHKTGKIMGVHILSAEAVDLIHEATIAVKFGLTIDQIIDTLHVFPTLSEAIKLVAQSFNKDISQLSCCVE
ncbi:mercury(II) reductase [Candidatus Saganbacteria bacterium]|nr:mercury(II) reductase [Candidatus Saganbacteria bacterium]